MTDEEKTSGEKQPAKRGKLKGKLHRRGSGSVFRRLERKGGKEWVAQIIPENGKTRQRYFSAQAEADEALTEMLYTQRQGTLITAKDQTVQQFLEDWFENVQRLPTVRVSTYEKRRHKPTQTLLTHIVSIPCDKILLSWPLA